MATERQAALKEELSDVDLALLTWQANGEFLGAAAALAGLTHQVTGAFVCVVFDWGGCPGVCTEVTTVPVAPSMCEAWRADAEPVPIVVTLSESIR